MKSRIRWALATVAVAVVATALPFTSSAAATPPAFEPDSNSQGSLTFYDAAGNVVTSGNDLSHLFDYAVASTPATRRTTKATLFFAFPDHTKPDSSTWFKSTAMTSSTYPNLSAPAPINTFTTPTAAASPGDVNLSALLSTTTLDTTPGYVNIVQLQLKDSGAGIGNGFLASPFWSADIQFDATAGTWTQVYPAPVPKTATSVSAITATPVSPAPAGTTSVALSATVSASDSSHPAGSVHLFDGATDLGAATFDAATGAVTDTATVADSTSYNYKFVFTPSASTYSGSSSAVLAYTVNGPAAVTTTVLSGPTTTTVGSPVTIHADVKGASGTAVPTAAGSVQFSIDGAAAGNPVPLTATGADFLYSPGAVGSKTVTAAFVPAAGQNYAASADTTGVTVAASAAQYNPDPQNVVVTVPAGTLVISTPYTASNPFNLGTLQLNDSGTQFSTTAKFGDPAATPAGDPGTLDASATASTSNGVTITDTRAGSTGWTASAQTTDFTGPTGTSTPINGDNLSFTGVTPKYLTGNALQTGSVTTNDISAFKSAKKSFAKTTTGPGTVNITGVIGLTAPTSTQAGLYTATITFTIA